MTNLLVFLHTVQYLIGENIVIIRQGYIIHYVACPLKTS